MLEREVLRCVLLVFFQAEDGIRDLVRSRGLGDVYKRQALGPQQDQAGQVETLRKQADLKAIQAPQSQ